MLITFAIIAVNVILTNAIKNPDFLCLKNNRENIREYAGGISQECLITYYEDSECSRIVGSNDCGEDKGLMSNGEYFNVLLGANARMAAQIDKVVPVRDIQRSGNLNLDERARSETGMTTLEARVPKTDVFRLFVSGGASAAGWAANGVTFGTACVSWDPDVDKTSCVLSAVSSSLASIWFLFEAYSVARVALTNANQNGVYMPWQNARQLPQRDEGNNSSAWTEIDSEGKLTWTTSDNEGNQMGGFLDNGLTVLSMSDKSSAKRDIYRPSPYSVQIRARMFGGEERGPPDFTYDALYRKFEGDLRCQRNIPYYTEVAEADVRGYQGSARMSAIISPYLEGGKYSVDTRRVTSIKNYYLSEICMNTA